LIKICKKIFYRLKISLFPLLIVFTGNRLSVSSGMGGMGEIGGMM
jgi:hypothetical protein